MIIIKLHLRNILCLIIITFFIWFDPPFFFLSHSLHLLLTALTVHTRHQSELYIIYSESNLKSCEHCPYFHARDYDFQGSRCIILAADYASNGIYNFIVPLRAHFHNPASLRPIILLLEKVPSSAFIDAISWFPLVYWMKGNIDKYVLLIYDYYYYKLLINCFWIKIHLVLLVNLVKLLLLLL